MPARILPVLLFLLLSAAGSLAGAQNALPPAVAQGLAAAKIPASGVAIVVQEAGSGRAELALNAAAPMNPASVMKLLTTYAALELLGPAYRWKTEAWVAGVLREGVLDGVLTLKGGGDPKLDLESFWILLRELRGKGLRELRGDLVLDRGHFEGVAGDAGRFDGDPFRPYNVLPDALLVNYRSLRFAFVPEAEQGTVRIYVEPRPPALTVANVLRLADGPCPEGRPFRDMLRPTFEPERQRAIFAGRYPASCGEKDVNVALLAPNDQVSGTFRQLWSELGGSWSGTAREGQAGAGARLLHSHESPALAEIVRDTNKFSNNVMGRQLFLTIGAAAGGVPGSAQKAIAALRSWVAAKGIAAPELVLENGVGLSRIERISAASLASLLQAAWRGPVMPEFVASLPIVGLDGTMRKRLKADGVSGQAHIKTGLLNDARAIGGYVLDRGGRRHVVVMLVNHPNAPEAQPAMDALLRWIYER